MNTFQKKFLMPMLGLAIALIGVQFFIAVPQQQKISQQASQLSQERVKAAIADDQQKTALITKKEFAQVEPIGKEFAGYFVDQNHILDFITQLETAAQRAGVQQTIQDLKPPATEKQSPMQLLVRGSFEGLQRYFVELEHLPYYVNTTHTSFVNEPSTQNISVTVQATIFWL